MKIEQQAFPDDVNYGMTLRDYFAAKVINGFSLSPWSDYEEMETFTRKDYARYCNSVAESAYEFADAMMKARTK